MRHLSIALLLLGLPVIASAQRAPHAPPPEPGGSLGSIGLPLPTIGLPLPSIGLPLPSIGPAPRTLGLSPLPLGDAQAAPEYQPGRRHHPRESVVYFVPTYPWGVANSWGPVDRQPAMASPPPPQPQAETGRLRFEVEPYDLVQVLVDGVYLGTPRDLGNELDLRPGPRRVEFRAPGYQTLTVDLRISAQRTISYRGSLDPVQRRDQPAADSQQSTPTPALAPAGSTTLYVIPGCYLGNVQPQEVRLPPGCDLSRLSIRRP